MSVRLLSRLAPISAVARAMTSLSSSFSTVPHVFNGRIEVSQLDDRQYRIVTLPNRLEALLISDEKADKAAASLDVSVGHLSDPDDMPGCAHFCEHLLFMGTEDFPSENEYSQFISTHGGSTNAYTSAHNTNYYFSVNPGSLAPALQRFSAFFKNPLFTPSCTSRELNAVDSEHKKNHQSDTWRLFQLGKHLSVQNHPWRKFGSGNRESLLAVGRAVKQAQGNGSAVGTFLGEDLHEVPMADLRPSSPASSLNSTLDTDGEGGEAGRETRRRLVEWWEQQYCASRMKLVILGKENLDELTTLATSLFAGVPDRSLPPVPRITDSPHGPDQKGVIVYTKTIMDFKAMEISWSIPWQIPHYQVKPGNFISHFVGHEGPGSIHSYLKNKGWITYLSSGTSGGAPGFDFFKITIVLTKEGLENHKTVLSVVYSYLSLLRSSPLPQWHQDEIITLSQIGFRFKEQKNPSSYVSKLAELMARPYPREKVLSASSVSEDWDEGSVRELLNVMKAENAKVTIMTREGWDSIGLAGPEESGSSKSSEIDNRATKDDTQKTNEEWLKEPWYGTEYQLVKVSQDIIDKAQAPNDIKELFLPGPNAFVPSKLEAEKKEVLEPLKRPLKILETPLSTLWYKKDDRFWVPKAYVNINIISPLASITARHNLATRLFADLVKDTLTEYAYDADLAGLSYSIANHAEGLSVSVAGYNDKLLVLLKVVLEKVKSFVVDEDRFAVLKEQLRQEYENMSMEQPYHLSDYYGRYLLAPRAWTPAEKLEELTLLTAADIQAHIPQLLSRVHIQALVHGNMQKDEAFNVIKTAEDILKARSLTPTELISDRALLLPEACNFVYEKDVPNKNDVNSALTYYFDIGDIIDARTRAILSLFAHICHEPAFNQLRTKEQLGYIVSTGMWAATGSVGFRVVVQSEKNPAYLENRVDAFFEENLTTLLQKMTDAEFDVKKQSLISKKLEKFKNLGEESGSFWNHITSGYHDFRRREVDAELLKGITKQDVVDLFMTKMHPSSKTRSKLSIHMRSQAKGRSTSPSSAPSPNLRFTVAASHSLLAILKDHGIVVDEPQYHDLSAAEPPLGAVKSFWEGHFNMLNAKPRSDKEWLSKENGEAILKEIDRIAATNSDESTTGGETEGKLGDDVVFIRDIAPFKAGLRIGKAATPVEIYNDLAGSKL
ncbi:Insulinase (Peptidase M16) [Tulasnella sp. 418]|nr:Insulinase (Peptidase M16) [Tulasnella sp. 418]